MTAVADIYILNVILLDVNGLAFIFYSLRSVKVCIKAKAAKRINFAIFSENKVTLSLVRFTYHVLSLFAS